jgi:choline dehydrogenase-like flavoprotein
MLENGRKVPTGTQIEADVCVVGAGPAGIPIALELGDAGAGVCLLEAGGLRPDRATQALLDAESPTHLPLDHTRLCCLGGTTKVWSGWCRPLDSEAFEPRDWVDESGWPYPRATLNPYFERAHRLCELAPYDYSKAAWETPSAPAFELERDLIETKVFHFSPPTKFGRTYRGALARSPSIRVLLHAIASELVPGESGRRIERIRVATLGGGTFEVVARFFVLAAGGIENPRLLLVSDSVQDSGVGNSHDLVGRYFMEHPYVNSGWLHLDTNAPSLAFYWRHPVMRNGSSGLIRGVFTMPESLVKSERLLNCVLFPLPPHEAHPSLSTTGADGLRVVAHAIRAGWIPPDIGTHLAAVARDPWGALVAASQRLKPGRQDLGSLRHVRLRSYCESPPRYSHRVQLTRSRDRLDRPGVRVDWEPSPLQRDSLKRAHELLDAALRQAGIGRAECELDTEAEASWEVGRHHMGTTRIHHEPERGVVDPDCRVHGVENLFVAGSSVFPTAGCANPTLTIIALSYKLADFLKGELTARHGARR